MFPGQGQDAVIPVSSRTKPQSYTNHPKLFLQARIVFDNHEIVID